MNTSIVRYILGHVLKLEGVFLLLPCLCAIIYQEQEGWFFLLTAGLCMLIGSIMSWKKPGDTVLYLKEGCVATSLSWIILSLFGCLPFFLSREIPNFRTLSLRRYPDLQPPEPVY